MSPLTLNSVSYCNTLCGGFATGDLPELRCDSVMRNFKWNGSNRDYLHVHIVGSESTVMHELTLINFTRITNITKRRTKGRLELGCNSTSNYILWIFDTCIYCLPSFLHTRFFDLYWELRICSIITIKTKRSQPKFERIIKITNPLLF